MNPNTKALVVSISWGVFVLLLSGCSGAPDITAYPDVRAHLDPEHATIGFPLDEFALSAREGYEVEHANALVVSECMAEGGFTFPRVTENWDTKAVPQERRYGLWSMVAAEQYGYELPADSRSAEIDEIEITFDDTWWATWRHCIDTTTQLPLMTTNSNIEHPSSVDRGISESNQNMRNTPEYSKAWQAWADCMDKKGISVQPHKDIMLPKLPRDNEEEQLRIAIIDVTCKQDLRTMQTIADIEAKFQAAYIDTHESELLEYRQKAQSVLAKARAIKATLG